MLIQFEYPIAIYSLFESIIKNALIRNKNQLRQNNKEIKR